MEKRFLSFVMVIAMCLGFCAQAVAATDSGITYTAVPDQSTFETGDEDRTVTVTVDASEEITWDGIGFKVYYDSPLVLTGITNKEVTLAGGDIQIEEGSGVNGAGFQTGDSENSTIRNICVLTFTIPANTSAGTYNLGIKELEITKDYAGTIIVADAEAMTTITVEEAPDIVVSGTTSSGTVSVEVENVSGTVLVLAAQYKADRLMDVQLKSVSADGTYLFEELTCGR